MTCDLTHISRCKVGRQQPSATLPKRTASVAHSRIAANNCTALPVVDAVSASGKFFSICWLLDLPLAGRLAVGHADTDFNASERPDFPSLMTDEFDSTT